MWKLEDYRVLCVFLNFLHLLHWGRVSRWMNLDLIHPGLISLDSSSCCSLSLIPKPSVRSWLPWPPNYMGSGDLNSGSHPFTASSYLLSISPALDSFSVTLFLKCRTSLHSHYYKSNINDDKFTEVRNHVSVFLSSMLTILGRNKKRIGRQKGRKVL